MQNSLEIHLSDHFTYKKLLRFTFPPVVMMVFTCLYGVVDGLFVTNFVGKSALAAINFVYPVLNILATFGYMFGAGGSALVAKTLGEGEPERANRLFSLFVYLTFLLGAVFAAAGYFLFRPLLAAFGASGQMLEQAVTYGYVLLAVLPFWNLQFLFQIFFVTAERPRLGLYCTLLAGFTNIVLDALFVWAFRWGIAGAAVATAMSQLAGGAAPLFYFFSRKNKSLLRLGRAQFDLKATARAFSNGLSEFVNGVSGSLVGILYNVQLLQYAGQDGVAAYSIMMYVSMIFIGLFFGYANGSAPVISYHYGAQNRTELKSLLKKSLVLTGTTALIMCIASEILAVPLSKIFAGYDEGLFRLTLNGFRIFAVSFMFSGWAIFGSSFFTALNNGPVSAVVSFLRTVVFQVGLVLLLPRVLGVDGIWLSVTAAEVLAVLANAFFLFRLREKYGYL